MAPVPLAKGNFFGRTAKVKSLGSTYWSTAVDYANSNVFAYEQHV